MLAITGTNGKTTVDRADRRADARRGPVDGRRRQHRRRRCSTRSRRTRPVRRGRDVFVLELSSYQLETTTSLKPVAAAVLNVSANHLDRYAGIADYAAREGAHVRAGDRADPESRRSDRAADAPARPHRADVRRRRAAVARRSGASSSAATATWLARGGELIMPASRAGARRPPQRAERARGTRARVVGGEARPAGARCARRVSRPAAPDGSRSPRRRACCSSTTRKARPSPRRRPRSRASAGRSC